MKICPFCGYISDDDACFCPQCGESIINDWDDIEIVGNIYA